MFGNRGSQHLPLEPKAWLQDWAVESIKVAHFDGLCTAEDDVVGGRIRNYERLASGLFRNAHHQSMEPVLCKDLKICGLGKSLGVGAEPRRQRPARRAIRLLVLDRNGRLWLRWLLRLALPAGGAYQGADHTLVVHRADHGADMALAVEGVDHGPHPTLTSKRDPDELWSPNATDDVDGHGVVDVELSLC